MFCPKCSELELEPVTQDKLEYLACINGCEGVWVTKKTLEKVWGKKKLKQLESELEEVKQPSFEDNDILKTEESSLEFEENIDDSDDFEKDIVDDDEDEDDDFDFDEDIEEEEFENEDDDITEEDDENEDDDIAEEEDDDEEIEEINFGELREGARLGFISENGEYDDPGNEASETFNETADLIDDDDDESIEIEEEETFFLSSPVTGHPMKRYFCTVKDKIKCSIGECTESESFWIDGSEEILTMMNDKKQSPKNFPELLCYDRPEEEIFEDDEDEDEDDEL